MHASVSGPIRRVGIALGVVLMLGANTSMAIETPKYKKLESFKDIEFRQYETMTIARTLVQGDFKAVGNAGFKRLAGYIFGENKDEKKISMTAPVSQSRADEDSYWITFMMPSQYDVDELPVPKDDRVKVSRLTEQTFAVISYKGGWSEKAYRKHEAKLLAQLKEAKDWEVTGEPVWARYNPPFVPAWFRTNEILVPVTRSAGD